MIAIMHNKNKAIIIVNGKYIPNDVYTLPIKLYYELSLIIIERINSNI